MNKKYPMIHPGEQIIIDWKTYDYKFACCDCSSVHKLRFTVKDNKVILQCWRDNRATSALRRGRKHK